MRRVILMLLLSVVSSNAVAEWIYVGKYASKINTMSIYVDYDTIRKSGKISTVWYLVNYGNSEPTLSWQSEKWLYENNCNEGYSRRTSVAKLSNHMGKDDVIYIDSIHADWTQVLPGTLLADLWKVACGRK